MTSPYSDLATALGALVARVRTDITAVKRADGVQAWTKEPLTPERLQRHLNGGPARGVCPIREGESVTMVGLLDFDSHGGETPWAEMASIAAQVMDAMEWSGGMPIAFRSSGGRGVHVYVLWDEPQDAYSVRQWLAGVLAMCGLRPGVKGVAHGQVEVFPKQDRVPAGGNGSQFILPLAGASVPLEVDDLAGILVERPGGRAAATAMVWPMSYPVPVVARPERPVVAPGGDGAGLSAELLSALAVLNAGGQDLDYDEWRNVVFALHHETGGSEAGRALAHEVSARSIKYDPGFLDERVWPYVHSDRDTAVTGRTILALARSRGWAEPIPADAFEPELDPDVHGKTSMNGAVGARGVADGAMDVDGGSGSGDAGEDGGEPARRGIPEAHHLTTDQANANRLVEAFGTRMLVAAGRWYAWVGTHWAPDESDVYRYGCMLSGIIHAEARRVRAKAEQAVADGVLDAAGKARQDKIADALEDWAKRSEMKATIENAIGLARKMLTVDVGQLDRDGMLLNVANGTVDLRTGELRAHRAEDYITKLVRLPYVAGAEAPTWVRALEEIYGGDAEVIAFAERWFGYCATADVSEQCFVVHWGGGGNGKSTILAAVADVLGDYAGTAAPGLLLASKSERHPTELASLQGLRMVTAHESGETATLREDMIKQATGSDSITARRMREDFFTFMPTHKLQLLTNHKPTVRGTDHGIWRRVRLLPYTVRFGSAEEVAAGEAQYVKDETMAVKLATRAEKIGILARIVRAAVAWRAGGLQAPGRVLLASEAYKQEQNRIGHFVRAVCELDPQASEPLTLGMAGLYPEYVSWSRDNGTQPVSNRRFLTELMEAFPTLKAQTGKEKGETGKRREVTRVHGIRILPE